MRVDVRRRVAQTDIEVTVLGLGAAPLGNYRHRMTDGVAADIEAASWDRGLRFVDTAPMYGHGLSEHRVGADLRNRHRESVVVSTKVGRLLRPRPREDVDFESYDEGLPFALEFDYGYDGVMRSFEDSLQRLGLDRVDILFIHDVDVKTHGLARHRDVFEEAMSGGYRALDGLRAQGAVQAIGLGVNEHEPCLEALRRHDFNCFLLAGRYTLLEQDALDEFLPLCEQRGASVIVGGGFNSGILATGAVHHARYDYGPAPRWAMERTHAIELVCEAYGVKLAAAALQFVLAHPVVVSVVAGARSVQQLHQSVAAVEAPIPADFWESLRATGLLRADAPTPLLV